MNESQQAALAALGSKATYGGAGTSLASWAVSSELGIVAGIVIGVAGFVVNWYYKVKQDRREQAEHDKRMAAK